MDRAGVLLCGDHTRAVLLSLVDDAGSQASDVERPQGTEPTVHTGARVPRYLRLPQGRSVVYVVTWTRSTVDVGVTTEPMACFAALRSDHGPLRLLVAYPGGADELAALRKRWAGHRVQGSTYRAVPEVLFGIKDLRDSHPGWGRFVNDVATAERGDGQRVYLTSKYGKAAYYRASTQDVPQRAEGKEGPRDGDDPSGGVAEHPEEWST